jgi:hypothetical protein
MKVRRAFRLAAVVIAVGIAASALTGCVRNVVNPAVEWLAGRDGIASAEVVRVTSTAWSSSGAVRGELDDGLDDVAIERLIGEVLDYLRSNQYVSFRLGSDRMDFSIADDAQTTLEGVAIWRDVVGGPGLVNGLVTHDQFGDPLVDARGLRESATELYDALAPVRVATRVGLFRDETALEEDWREGAYAGDHPAAATIAWGADCQPDRGIVDFAIDLANRDDIVGGWLGLCDIFELGLAEPEHFAERVPELRAELDAIPAFAQTGFPVTLQTSDVRDPSHIVAVTPNDPTVYGVLAELEDETAGADADSGFWQLAADGVLTWKDFGEAADDLIARLAATPASTALSYVEITGDGSTVGGRIDELPGLLEHADALDAAAASIGSVHLSPTDGSFYLASGDSGSPDVDQAATALRDSGLWQGRSIVVKHLNAFVELRDGVVQPIADYTDPAIIESFIAAWEASATASG